MSEPTQNDNPADQPLSIEELSFEESIERLESLIERIESGQVGLEEALKHYEQGAALIKHCQTILTKTEKRIAELTVTDDGNLVINVQEDETPTGESADDDDTDVAF